MTATLYNVSSQNLTGVFQLVQYTNTVSNNMWSPLLVISLFLISFFGLSRYGMRQSIPASCFISMIAAIVLYLMSALPDFWMYGAMVAFATSTLALFFID